jgi:4-hydroxybenzoate polyprenyltransferase
LSHEYSGASGLFRSSVAFAKDIKLAHSVFALPFAAASFFIGQIPLPGWSQVLLLLSAMISARTFAMGMNRWLDRDIDKLNVRTSGRAVPSGVLSPRMCILWSAIAALVLILSSFLLSRLAGMLSFPLLLLLAGYSLMKRVSWLTHLYLGACLGFAPVAVEVALKGEFSIPVLLLAGGVTFWTAGFDILYSLQDEGFDKKMGLRSIPARFGARAALQFSRICFLVSIALFCWTGWSVDAGWPYFFGTGLIAAILFWEQFYVRNAAEGLEESRLNAAFFTANAWVSVVFLIFCVFDSLWGRLT